MITGLHWFRASRALGAVLLIIPVDHLTNRGQTMDVFDETAALWVIPIEGSAVGLPIDTLEGLLVPAMLLAQVIFKSIPRSGLLDHSFKLRSDSALWKVKLNSTGGQERYMPIVQVRMIP